MEKTPSYPHTPSPLSAVERIGLTTIHKPDEPLVDIVLVHGFNGHPERTWTHKRVDDDSSARPEDLEGTERPSKFRKLNPFKQSERRDEKRGIKKEVYWPRDLLPHTVEKARVLVFGYDTSVHHMFGGSRDRNTVYDFAWELLNCLGDARELEGASHRPLLFVAHSLGGIITKEALRQAKAKGAHPPNAHLGSILSSTIGIIFFGTPHRGADPRGLLHHVAEQAIRAAGFTANRNVVETLLPNSERLKQLCDEFPLLASEMKWKIVSFRETRGMKILGGSKVVDDASSCLGDPTLETVRDIESDHRDMCRFSSLDDPRFQKVAAAIRRILQPTLAESGVHREQLEPDSEPRDLEPTFKVPTLSEDRQNELVAELRFKQMDARLWSLKSAQAKTCRWLLRNKYYKDWTNAEKLTDHHGFFWIKGKPGTGKSTMMKFLFLEAKKIMRGSLVLSFFFNARGEDLEKSTSGLYRSLLLQLLEKAPETRSIFDSYGSSGLNTIKEIGWQNETLREAFAMALTKLGNQRVVCFIDALDECPEEDVRDMVAFFEELGDLEKEAEFRVCFSSRHYPEISIRTGLQLVLEQEQDHTKDITLYLDTHLKLGADTHAEEIKDEVLRKSSNIFLWVVLVIPILNKEFDRGRVKALKKRLTEIPIGLHDLFLDILTRDNKNMDELLLCIQWILFGSRPLSPVEFRAAVEMGGDVDSSSEPCYPAHMTAENLRKFVLDVSKGLAEITKSKEPTVQFIHESVRDFLLKDGGMAKLFRTDGKLDGYAHEALKTVCQRCLLEPSMLPSASKRETILEKYPLLSYALESVFAHANWAQKLGVDQLLFINAFDMDKWRTSGFVVRGESSTNNFYQDHNGLLYVLAEHGAADLIRIHPRRSTHLTIKCNRRFVFPLLAALYSGHHSAARALCNLPPLISEQGAAKAGGAQPRINLALKKSEFRRSTPLLVSLCQAGDADILRAVLRSGQFKSLSDAPRTADLCLVRASSEAVVDVLVEFNAIPLRPLFHEDGSQIPGSEEDGEDIPPIGLPHLRRALNIDPSVADTFGSKWIHRSGLLEYAAARGFEQMARLGIGYASESQKSRAFISAAIGCINQGGRVSIMKSLIEAGVSPPKTLSLIRAMDQPHNEEVIAMLLSLPSLDLEQRRFPSDPVTPLHWTIQNERKKYVKLLLSAGANPMARTACGDTALILAVKMSDSSSFQQILAHPKCEPDARDNNGQTALFWCAAVADDIAIEMASELIQRADIDPNATDGSGRTVLVQAVRSGKPELVRALLESARIDPDLAARSHPNRTPLRVAVNICRFQNHRPFWEIARLLILSLRVHVDISGRLGSPYDLARRFGLEDMVVLMEGFTTWKVSPLQRLTMFEWTGAKTGWQLMYRRRYTELSS